MPQTIETAEAARERVDREASATIKRTLTEMEELAEMAPRDALDPVQFNERRRRVMRSIWNLVKLALAAGPPGTTDA